MNSNDMQAGTRTGTVGTAETYEPAKRVVRSRYWPPIAIPYLGMFTKGPLHAPVTLDSVVGGATWGYVTVSTWHPTARARHARGRARGRSPLLRVLGTHF